MEGSHSGAQLGAELNTEYRTVFHRGTEGSLNVNLTELGIKVHDIEEGQQLPVEVHEHGIWIPTDEEGRSK
jgi:hypothetical protein